jgi:hypothetical protein
MNAIMTAPGVRSDSYEFVGGREEYLGTCAFYGFKDR